MDIKYTTDGRKVRVIGNLNNRETIVQEIFIDDTGAEIPSGENFVVKSLHDAPRVSWQEKELKNIEQEYKSAQESFKRKADDMRRQTRKVAAIIRASKEMERFFSMEKFKKLDLFLAGAFTHLIITKWSGLEIVEFGAETEDYNTRNIKLLTLFGRAGGELNWKLNTYSDGSGCSYIAEPCFSYEDALEKAQVKINAIVEEKGASDDLIWFSKKHKLHISKRAIADFMEKRIDREKGNIAEKEKILKKAKLELKNLIKTGWADQRKRGKL